MEHKLSKILGVLSQGYMLTKFAALMASVIGPKEDCLMMKPVTRRTRKAMGLDPTMNSMFACTGDGMTTKAKPVNAAGILGIRSSHIWGGPLSREQCCNPGSPIKTRPPRRTSKCVQRSPDLLHRAHGRNLSKQEDQRCQVSMASSLDSPQAILPFCSAGMKLKPFSWLLDCCVMESPKRRNCA